MPKISDKVVEYQKVHGDEPFFSFEYFPPKTEAGVQNLLARMDKMGAMRPMWIDVTWGAGGSTAETTQLLCETAMDVTGLDVLMHLTCTNVTVETTRKVLQRCKDKGLCNILALRGDPPAGMDQAWTATEGGFKHAVDLVKFIRKEFGDYFCIGVAAYPEGHVDYLGENGAIDQAAWEQDMKYFKDKVDAGADFAVTQLFYDCEKYGTFLKKCKAMGIPDSFKVYPGIMPIQNYAGFKRMTGFCKTFIPKEITEALEPIQNDDQAVKEYGIKLGVEMSKRCIELGAPGVHLYTLNLETSATAIVEELGLLDVGDAAKLAKDYPWNRSTGSRGIETTRPIFWAQRQRSYVDRTAAWDEFPNGRFGSRESPAYGLFATPPKPTDKQLEELKKQWAFTDAAGLKEVFCKFLTPGGEVKSLPWCPEQPGDETVCIRSQLQRMCRTGCLTINSQPRLNGALSTDALFGWGPAGGVVYQKAYAEFFCSPATWALLEEHLSKTPTVELMGVTRKGELKASHDTQVTAVTWGVFPGQEIQQPTVVDSQAFLAWRDEAFALWDQFLTVVPEDNAAARALVKEVQDSWYLVNCVDNNFLSGDLFQTLLSITGVELKKTLSSAALAGA